MACTTTVTGGCTTAIDAYGCSYKPVGTLNAIGDLFVQGQTDSLDITWDSIDDPTYLVNVFYREQGGAWKGRQIVAKTTGTASTVTLTPNSTVELFVRPETATELGEWVRIECLVNDQWTSESKDVYFGESIVLFGTEQVITG